MKKYILYNMESKCVSLHDCFNDAEKAAFEENRKGVLESNLFIGKLSHRLVRKRPHLETEFIDSINAKDGYIPQEGDVFCKIKNYKNAEKPDLVFEREVVRVNPDSVVLRNSGSNALQAMPIYQWLRWIKGAEFKKRAGVEIK